MMMVKKGSITAPDDYWKLTKEEKEETCNSAGPKGYGWIVPDSLWGLDCTPCFNIHDYCYSIWSDTSGKEVADRLMLDNLYSYIEAESSSSWWCKPVVWLRRQRAYNYYLAVNIGGSWFYN